MDHLAKSVMDGSLTVNQALAKAFGQEGATGQVRLLRRLCEMKKAMIPKGKVEKFEKKKKPEAFEELEEREEKAGKSRKKEESRENYLMREKEGPKEGSLEYHRDKAMKHLMAAQAHANAHFSAKKIAETKDHDTKVRTAEEASQQALMKGMLHINRSHEDALLKAFGEGMEIGADASVLPDPWGPQRLGAYHKDALVKGTIYEGECDRPRGGDMREMVSRIKEQMQTVEDDPAGNEGNGGLHQWFRESYGGPEVHQINVPVGFTRIDRNEGEPHIRVIDDDDPYHKALYRTDPRDDSSNMRLAYQGEGRETVRRG
jgi:hypothetical protein